MHSHTWEPPVIHVLLEHMDQILIVSHVPPVRQDTFVKERPKLPILSTPLIMDTSVRVVITVVLVRLSLRPVLWAHINRTLVAKMLHNVFLVLLDTISTKKDKQHVWYVLQVPLPIQELLNVHV